MSKRNRKNKTHEGNTEFAEQEVHSGEAIELSDGDVVTINQVAGSDPPVEPIEETPADYEEDLADESEDHALYEERKARGEQEDEGGPSSDQIDAFEAAMSDLESSELSPEDTIAALRAELESLQRQGEGRRIKSGSKPRPNVTYTLLKQPPSWSTTPQLAQIEQILFSNRLGEDGGFARELPEPTVFELLEQGKSRGALRTNQPAIRVFQYYRNRMLKDNTIRWE